MLFLPDILYFCPMGLIKLFHTHFAVHREPASFQVILNGQFVLFDMGILPQRPACLCHTPRVSHLQK